jgi:hypothetical protein
MSEQPPIDQNTVNTLAAASQNVMDIISKQQQMDKVQALLKLLNIEDLPITVVGEKQSVLSLELMTEYPNANYVKMMVKNETWRASCREVFHLPSIDKERIVGIQDIQIMLKMVSFKRKRPTEVINGLRNEVSGTEVIPSNTRKKRFFGMI